MSFVTATPGRGHIHGARGREDHTSTLVYPTSCGKRLWRSGCHECFCADLARGEGQREGRRDGFVQDRAARMDVMVNHPCGYDAILLEL